MSRIWRDRPLASDRFDVAIVGASAAGLTLALALARELGAGARIAVLDREPVQARLARTDVRAYALAAGGRRMLTALGVWPAIVPFAEPVAEIEITDSALADVLRPAMLTYENTLEGTSEAFATGLAPETATHIVPADALMRALADAVAAEPAIAMMAPAAVVGLTVGAIEATITLAEGGAITTRLAVAADGRRSALREAAGIGVVGWRYPQTAIVTTVAHELPHGGRAVQHFLPAGPFAILPLPGSRACITWTEAEGAARRILALDEAGFLAEVEQRFAGRVGALRLDGPRQSWPLEMHLTRRYAGPRLAIIGDAAHGVHPIAGQGLNLALRDVAALTDCLGDGARMGLDLGDITLLERYERWRRFDSMAAATAFDAINRLFSNDIGPVRLIRDLGLGLVDRLPGLKRLIVREAAGLTGDVPRLMRAPGT